MLQEVNLEVQVQFETNKDRLHSNVTCSMMALDD